MITADEEKYILAKAYIPEHIVGLMTGVSGGEPFLIDNYFYCQREDWLIFVGYPLEQDFVSSEIERVIDRIRKGFRPRILSLIAPEMPPSLTPSCQERESDDYYTLDLPMTTIKSSIKRLIKKAKGNAMVERSGEMGEAHKALTEEFIQRANPPARVRNLFLRMPEYVGNSEGAVTLNAWNKEGNLAAFNVVDLAAKQFAAYVIGCHSKRDYVAGASDLLCLEMINMGLEYGKRYIHLGLGVNEGIRQFKKKWGGLPTRKYEMCEMVLRKPSIFDAFRDMGKIG